MNLYASDLELWSVRADAVFQSNFAYHFGMNIQQAIEAPRWATWSFPASSFPHTMHPGDMAVEARIPEATRQALIARRHKLRIRSAWSLGSNAGIVVDSTTGVLSAGAEGMRSIILQVLRFQLLFYRHEDPL